MIYFICMEGDDLLIKIIGSNCPTGRRLIKQIKNVCHVYHKTIDILELNNHKDKLEYHVNLVPAIVLNDKIISQGKVLSNQELKRLIFNASN